MHGLPAEHQLQSMNDDLLTPAFHLLAGTLLQIPQHITEAVCIEGIG